MLTGCSWPQESCGNGPNGTDPKHADYTGTDYLGLAPTWRAMLEDTCPFSFYRISVDVAPQFFSTVHNLNRALPYLQTVKPLSRPGCWAYPDMLEVGVAPMSFVESQTHFAMWAITSAPLILGFDLHDSEVVNANWAIIANKEVLNVSQTWAGHPGYLVKNATGSFTVTSQAMGIYDRTFFSEIAGCEYRRRCSTVRPQGAGRTTLYLSTKSGRSRSRAALWRCLW